MRHRGRQLCNHCSPHKGQCKLSDAECRKMMKISHIHGDEAYIRRLSCMGILCGKRIAVLRRHGRRGAMMIQAGDSKFAMDAGLYDNIEVEEEQ